MLRSETPPDTPDATLRAYRITQYLILIVWLLFLAHPSQAQSPARVLLISSYHPGFPTFFQQIEGVKSVLDQRRVVLDVEFMDSKRFHNPINLDLFARVLSYKLARSPDYDVILTADDNALTFAIQHHPTLLDNKPIVFFGVNSTDRILQSDASPWITGVLEAVSMRETIELITRLQPKAQRIIALVDSTPSGQADLKTFYQVAPDFEPLQFDAISLERLSFDEFLERTAALDNRSAVLLLSAYRDKNGRSMLFHKSLQMIMNHLSIPLYHLWYHGLGDGILGGKVISHYQQGAAAAKIVLQILDGTPVEAIPVIQESPNQYVFDYRQLTRFGLDISDLPADATILNMPNTVYHQHKRLFWSVVAGATVFALLILMMSVNIFHRKQAEAALRHSEERLNAIIKSIPDLVYRLDQNGNITFISDAVERYGYTPGELINANILDLVHAEDQEKARYRINERRTGERITNGLEVRLLPKKNMNAGLQKGPVNFENAPVLTVTAEGLYTSESPDKRHFMGTQGIARDVTQAKRVEKDKQQLEEKLYAAQKMEAIGTLAGGVAHDFNNLLMGIQGYTSLMLMDTRTNHVNHRRLKNIEEAVESAAALTRQLLGFARGGRYEVKSTDLNRLVQRSAKMFGRTRKEIVIQTQLQKDVWSVEVDQGQISQVLLNLFVNAWQAMPDGGTLDIRTSNVVLSEASVQPFALTPGDYVRISVVDTGVGMDEATKQRIFEPFFTTKRVERGTGLGLACAYGIIKSHHGFIDVASQKGQGTTFQIFLPASKKAVVQEPKPTKELLQGTETILVVDDERQVIDVAKGVLEWLGYQVLASTNGEEALTLYRQQHDDIDLVILDMVMPGLGGGKIYEGLRSINPAVKVLLSSGYSLEGEAKKILARGCNGFLQKPFSATTLSRKLREILDRA